MPNTENKQTKLSLPTLIKHKYCEHMLFHSFKLTWIMTSSLLTKQLGDCFCCLNVRCISLRGGKSSLMCFIAKRKWSSESTSPVMVSYSFSLLVNLTHLSECIWIKKELIIEGFLSIYISNLDCELQCTIHHKWQS